MFHRFSARQFFQAVWLVLFSLLITAVNTSYAQNSEQLFKEAQSLKSSGKDSKALKKFEEALTKAESEKNVSIQMQTHLELAELKDNVVNYKEALDHYKAFSTLYKKQLAAEKEVLQDSVSNLHTTVQASQDSLAVKDNQIQQHVSAIDSLTTEQLQSELQIKDLELSNSQKELELQAAANRRNILLFALALLVVVAGFVTQRYFQKRKGVRLLRQKNYEIIHAKQKSDELLLNILPEKIAEELKEFGRTTPNRHNEATVMFTDFKGFTKFSEKHSPEELVKLVDFYFRAFDKIVEKHHIEKIKTIGDAYMCVSGIPQANKDHAANMIHAAFECMNFVKETAALKESQGLPYLEMRIGIHSGPLVAGVVGSRKFAYDIWGDTVNIAARMEQSGSPGQINVSESVHQLTNGQFQFEYRGEIAAKNKGLMKMYFVQAAK